MNATVTVKIHKRLGFTDTDGEPHGFFRDIFSGDADFLLNIMALRFWKVQTYPYEVDGLCFVSLEMPLNFVDKLLSVLPFKIWLCFAAASCVSILTLNHVIFKEPALSLSILEFFRMFAQSASIREPRDSIKRIFFIILLIMVFVTNSYIMGRLSSISTAPDYTVINSVEDLLDSKFPIYGLEGFKALIGRSELLKRFRNDRSGECRKLLLKGERVICLEVCKSLGAGQYDFPGVFASKNKIITRPEAFATSDDWPLYSKMNKLLLIMNDGGLNSLFRKRDELRFLHMLWEVDENVSFTDLEELYYCAYLYLGSCIAALHVFFLEILICKCKKMHFRQIFTYLQRMLQNIRNRKVLR